MATKGLKELLRRAYKAKDEGELKELENEGEGEHGDEMDNAMHIHVHPGERRDERREPRLDARRRDARRRDDDDPEGDDDVDKLCDRMDAMERDLEEMKAQHEEMLSELSEDARHRLGDRRDRRRDARRRDAGRRDARRHDESEEEEKKREAEDARRRDAAESEKEEEKRKEAEDARHRDEEANKKIEGELEMEAPPGTGDKARKARDSAYLEDSFQATVAMAEILAPGQKYPTFDRAATPKSTFDTICNLRRTTLDAAYKEPTLHTVIEDAVGGDFDARVKVMDCGQVRTLFRSVAAFQRQRNNAGNGYRAADDGASGAGGGMGPIGIAKSPAELNKRNAEFWASRV